MKFNFDEIKYTPNLITLFRLLLILPTLYISFFINDLEVFRKLLFSIIIVAFLSDILDGFVARKLNLISELGKLLDPLADKILTGIIVIVLWSKDYFPTYYLIILMLRDLLILSGGMYVSKRINRIIPSNYFGKATIFSIGLFFLTLLILGKNDVISYYLMIISLVMSFISIIIYFNRGIKILRANGTIQ